MEKPFPAPGQIWQWTGHPSYSPASLPRMITGLRWFITRCEVLFDSNSCAGVDHLMTRPEWVYHGFSHPLLDLDGFIPSAERKLVESGWVELEHGLQEAGWSRSHTYFAISYWVDPTDPDIIIPLGEADRIQNARDEAIRKIMLA